MTRLDPTHAEARLNLGVLFAGNNQLDDAEQEYRKVLELNPNLVEAHYNLGVFYEFHKKDTEAALTQYRKYLALGGKDKRIQSLVEEVSQ